MQSEDFIYVRVLETVNLNFWKSTCEEGISFSSRVENPPKPPLGLTSQA